MLLILLLGQRSRDFFSLSQRRGTKEKKSNLKTKEKAGGEAATSLAGAKAGGGVVSTHEGHTGAQASQPKEHQLPHSLRFHGGRPDPDGGGKKHQISPRSPPPVPGGGKKVEKNEGGETESQWGRTPLEGRAKAAVKVTLRCTLLSGWLDLLWGKDDEIQRNLDGLM
ncbi:hypothetical protein B296_00050261 [Ensete ventricosum]|uniref:Uncharacterized protein n=1 Tax=Ensete ventricosum TaxID=4639 RepID=A0A426X9V8_ENSVE|nr:hypothetical protein B296_00050261 [Ensete ventricosum]